MYTHKSYGRQAEVAALYAMFEAGRNVKMPGPRRLGKTFVLDRLVDAAPKQNWVAVKVELAGHCMQQDCFTTNLFSNDVVVKIDIVA